MLSSSKKTRKNKFTLGNLLYLFGIILAATSVVVILTTISPAIKEEVKYDLNQKNSSPVITPLDTDFGIVIPKIKANSRVIKNVDPKNQSEYEEALSRGVAHAKGTALPGTSGNIFLFSHSSVDFWQATKYNSIFYLLNKLEKGDKIEIYYLGKKYIYSIQSKKIVSPNDLSVLTRKTNDQTLTLMTCWPPGTSLNRLIIQATIQLP